MNNDLSILFSKDGFSFYVTNKGDLVHQETTLYIDNDFNNQDLNQLQKLTKQKALYWKQNYAHVQVILHSFQFNIIPQEIYSEFKEPEFWLEYNTEIFEGDPIITTTLESIHAMLVFSYASEIKTALNEYFDDYELKHSLILLLNAAQQHTGKRVYANLFLNTLEVMVMEDQQLILYNIYSVKTKEDFSYYILNTYKVTKTKTVEAPLYYHGTNLDDYMKMLSNFISILKPLDIPL